MKLYLKIILFVMSHTLVFANNFTQNYLSLSIEEKNYLKNKQSITLCIDPDWMPLEKIDHGQHVGLSADFMQQISQKLAIPFQLIETNSWAESLQKIKNKQCDILALTESTPSRQKYLNFTTPYLTLPLVVATKIGEPFSTSLESLMDKTFGIVKNYSQYELLKNKYPSIKLIEFDSMREGLDFVNQEKIFGFIDNAMVLNHEIQTVHMIENITISGQFKEKNYLSIASRKDEPILNDILEKALSSLDESTKSTFINKWSSIRYETNTDYTLLVQMLFLGLVILSIFVYWNLLLKEEIKKKEIAQKLLQENEEKFRTLFEIAPVLLNAFDKNGTLIMWNKECERVFGWTKEEINSHEQPISLFYPDMNSQDEIQNIIAQNEPNVYQEWHPKTKDGRVLTTRWANVNLQNDEVIHIGYDITEDRKNKLAIEEKKEQLRIAKEELQELNNSLEKRIENEIKENTKHQALIMHQSKLVQMGEMIENIAHQWRQPLAQINSSVLLVDARLVKNQFEDEMVEDKLLEIESLTAYMSKTIDDFKNFFDPDKKKTLFSIKSAIEKAYDIVKGSLKADHIEVIITVDETIQYYGYLEELQQVFLTLLNNARDAIVSNKIAKGKIAINVFVKDRSIIIVIEDNALGIDEQYINKVFEPYFTTKHKSQGTGLGLYMAKMIVESALYGTLTVNNNIEGATFTITVPQGEE